MKKTSESRTLVPWLRGRPWQTNRWITTGSQGSSEKQRNLYVYRRRRWNFTDTLSTYVFRCKASLTLARILFPRCFAMWRAKLCHLSRISYELFTKCVTPSVTRVHFTMESWQVVTPWKNFLNISRSLPRHGTHYFTGNASPCILTHTVTSCFLIGTPNCVPWRKPFVVPVRGLLNAVQIAYKVRYAEQQIRYAALSTASRLRPRIVICWPWVGGGFYTKILRRGCLSAVYIVVSTAIPLALRCLFRHQIKCQKFGALITIPNQILNHNFNQI